MSIPAIFCVDVEPDLVQVPRSSPSEWSGVDHVFRCTDQLRHALEASTGEAPVFGWYLRMDAQIAACEGSADFVAQEFGEQLERRCERGDVLGLHVHPFRWSDNTGMWTHHFDDQALVQDTIADAYSEFRQAFGEPARRHRFGAGYLSDTVVDELERHGTVVDLTLEPGRRGSTHAPPEAPMTGSYPDTRRVPQAPYRPARADFRVADDPGRTITLVPLSATSLRLEKPRWWRAARRVRRGLRPPSVVLQPWRDWGSPELYWDAVSRHLASTRQPYLAFAIRSHRAMSPPARRMEAALRALPSHPLARRLRFTDPIEVAGNMLGLGAPRA